MRRYAYLYVLLAEGKKREKIHTLNKWRTHIHVYYIHVPIQGDPDLTCYTL